MQNFEIQNNLNKTLLLKMLDNELQALNQQVNSHTIRSPTPVPNTTHKMNKYVDMAKKCCKTPLLYFTLVPILVLLIFMLARPPFIYDTDKETNKRSININKLLGSIIGITVGINAFIYFYLIKKCNYKI